MKLEEKDHAGFFYYVGTFEHEWAQVHEMPQQYDEYLDEIKEASAKYYKNQTNKKKELPTEFYKTFSNPIHPQFVMDLFYEKTMELKAFNDPSDKKSLMHTVALIFKRTKGQAPHTNPTTSNNLKIMRSLIRSGYPLNILDYHKYSAIGLLVEKSWNVPDDVLCKVAEDHINMGFDVL